MTTVAPRPTDLPAGLTPERYLDKVRGGWVGKCAGGILGAPIEGYKRFNDIPLSDALFESNFANDDLDLQVLWLDLVDRLGPHVRRADLARHWAAHVRFPWGEYGFATRNIALGLDPPMSGRHDNWYWRRGMGSPIRSEIWGMLYPGQPAAAAFYARMDSELDHDGFSVEAECYFSAAAALAFVREGVDALLDEALGVLPDDGDCARLVRQVTAWYRDYGFDVCAGKIKSYYGDADFTSAPMNVAFTVLSLRHAGGAFDGIMPALHLGHDSDCVVATAGALLGIAAGYERIPAAWRERVGDELLISEEVSGIRIPATVTELSEWTVEVGRRIAGGWGAPARPYAFHVADVALTQEGRLRAKLAFERLDAADDEPLLLTYKLQSSSVDTLGGSVQLAAGDPVTEVEVETPARYPLEGARLPFAVEVAYGRQTDTFARGCPTYGEWLLVGPLIVDDRAREPLDERYPDHGLASLPSVDYMNHDRLNVGRDDGLVGPEAVAQLLRGEVRRDDRDYQVRTLRPAAMAIDLGAYFVGRGERTLYLATVVETAAARKVWLCLGSSGYLTAWLDGALVLQHRELSRRWPGTAVVEVDLRAGANALVIRLDAYADDYGLDVGFKDHRGRHHHQSHWCTDLTYRVPEGSAS